MTLEASFNSLCERIGSDDLEMLCQTILIQRKVGGNLTEVLDKISETIRNRLDLKEEIKTLTSSGKISGYIIGALPVILLVLISMINPVYARPLFNTVIGNILLLISVILEVIGFIMINKVVDIKY
jgi:tight adherence protein B